MALLDETNRVRILAQLQRVGGLGSLGTLTKADLRAAVDATDSWIDTNSASYNTALPQPSRAQLTATQKVVLFCFVAMRRAGLLRAEGD